MILLGVLASGGGGGGGGGKGDKHLSPFPQTCGDGILLGEGDR